MIRIRPLVFAVETVIKTAILMMVIFGLTFLKLYAQPEQNKSLGSYKLDRDNIGDRVRTTRTPEEARTDIIALKNSALKATQAGDERSAGFAIVDLGRLAYRGDTSALKALGDLASQGIRSASSTLENLAAEGISGARETLERSKPQPQQAGRKKEQTKSPTEKEALEAIANAFKKLSDEW